MALALDILQVHNESHNKNKCHIQSRAVEIVFIQRERGGERKRVVDILGEEFSSSNPRNYFGCIKHVPVYSAVEKLCSGY